MSGRCISVGCLLVMAALVGPLPSLRAAQTEVESPALTAYQANNYPEAMRLFRPLAEQGDPQAQYYVGRMYEKGDGIERNPGEVVKWYTLSANAGYAPAQYRLAIGYAFGFAGLPQSNAEAIKWLRKSAEGDHKKAQETLGRAYEEGRFGLPVDKKQAEHWLRKAESPP